MEQYLDIFKLLTLMINENILGSNSKIISKENFINKLLHQKKIPLIWLESLIKLVVWLGTRW